MTILCSACLLGVNCRYSGKAKLNEDVLKLREHLHFIPVCPEQLGGLCTPRLPAEQRDGRVYAQDGSDMTDAFTQGAEETLRLAKLFSCSYAILKERSPSCGYGMHYDGTFSGTLVPGNGVTAQLLAQNGIQIIGESKIQELYSLL